MLEIGRARPVRRIRVAGQSVQELRIGNDLIERGGQDIQLARLGDTDAVGSGDRQSQAGIKEIELLVLVADEHCHAPLRQLGSRFPGRGSRHGQCQYGSVDIALPQQQNIGPCPLHRGAVSEKQRFPRHLRHAVRFIFVQLDIADRPVKEVAAASRSSLVLPLAQRATSTGPDRLHQRVTVIGCEMGLAQFRFGGHRQLAELHRQSRPHRVEFQRSGLLQRIDPLVQAADDLAEHVRFRPAREERISAARLRAGPWVPQGIEPFLHRVEQLLAVVIFQVVEILDGKVEQLPRPLRGSVARVLGLDGIAAPPAAGNQCGRYAAHGHERYQGESQARGLSRFRAPRKRGRSKNGTVPFAACKRGA